MGWVAWDDLVGLSGVGSGFGTVFGNGMVQCVDFLALTEGTMWIGQVWRWAEMV